VFTVDLLDSYLDLKREEWDRFRTAPHPVEFDLYYSA
jgi:glutamine synthetase